MVNMAVPSKKQMHKINKVNGEEPENSDGDIGDEFQHEEIQVDFEGRTPIDSDYHGIKLLLTQLFLKSHINVGEMTDIIIGQNHIGSVLKQCEPEDEIDDEDDDTVFGISSVINLTEKRDMECVQSLKTLMVELCQKHASSEVSSFLTRILEDSSSSVGLLINERFSSIPSQTAVPLLENLNKEIKKACSKHQPFNFSYYIIICKLYKVDSEKSKEKKKKKKNKPEEEGLWANPEEEIFNEKAVHTFEFSVKQDSDSALVGEWDGDDVTMIPYRRVIIIEASKLESAIAEIKSEFQT